MDPMAAGARPEGSGAAGRGRDRTGAGAGSPVPAVPAAPGPLRPTDLLGAFFLCAVVMALAGAAVAITDAFAPWAWGRWLALHLLFIGGISQLILGASQFFAGAFLATDPPPRPLVRAQLVAWNAGTVCLAIAVPERVEALTIIGVALLLGGLALYAAGLRTMSRRALNHAPWASRWYLLAAAFLAPGILAGVAMANGYTWTHGFLLDAHMALNLAGWFGAAIVGTLHTFFPSLARTQLRWPRLQGATFGAWAAGVVALALGYGFAVDGLAVAGWILLAAAATLLLANIVGTAAAARTPLSLPARLVGVAQLFLLAGLLVAAVVAIGSGPAQALVGSTRAAVATLLVAGWISLTVGGSLLHLLALLNRVGDQRRGLPETHPARDAAIAAITAIAVAALAFAHLFDDDGAAAIAAVAVACVFAGLGARIVLLAGRAAIRARPRI